MKTADLIKDINKRIIAGLPCYELPSLRRVDCREYLKSLGSEPDHVENVNGIKLHSSYRICQSCENYQADTDKCRLGSCGCYLHTWAMRASSRCPIQKFDNLEEFYQNQRQEFHYR